MREVVLPGLPLGQGPARTYRDVELELPPGCDLVLCSDGLSEARTAAGVAYGFERLESELAAAGGETAEEVLDHLVGCWRQEVGARASAGDTTLVILRRAG